MEPYGVWPFGLASVTCCPGKGSFISAPVLLVADRRCIVWRDHIELLRSRVDGHVGCVHVSATVNVTAVNTGVESPLFSSLKCVLKEPMVGSRGNSVFDCLRSRHTVLLIVFVSGEDILTDAGLLPG